MSIGLANLTINVNANVASVVNEMAAVKATTHASMLGSSSAVNDFQKSVARDSALVQNHARAMGVGLDQSSVSIAKSAQASADSIAGISESAEASASSIKALSKGLDDAGREMKKAIGPEVSAQIESTTEKVEEFTASRIAIAAVGLAFGAVAGTVAAVGYAAYKASGFLAGLISGESYKSPNIDALITETDKIKALQKELEIASVDATALNDALNRLGVNKSDIVAVKGNVDGKLHGGETTELDRLGVDWKGKDPATIIQNAKNVLDQYTEGWDRNQAAVAMGLGSYEQMTNYLKVNQEEMQKSKSRLDDFGLGIGPETQAAVERYQVAMRLFNNETKLMGDGFKRVIADTTMPILTNFAGYLTEGWPSVVNFFRGVSASFASILLGLDSAAYIAVKGIVGSLTAMVDEIEGVVRAAAKLAQGDTSGAWAELVKGHKNAEKTMADTGDAMVKHAKDTVSALKQAWAFDDRIGVLGAKPKKGKSFVPKPGDPGEEEAGTETVKDDSSIWARVHAKYLDYLKSFNATAAELVKTGAAEQMELNQQAYDWGLISQEKYLDAKHALSEKALQDEIGLKKKELNNLSGEVFDHFLDKSAEGALAYVDALKKEQDVKTQIVTLEGKLNVVRLQNADESKRMTKDQSTQYADLGVQIMELTGQYEKAAIARQLLEQSDPKFKALPQDIQDRKNAISNNAISQGRARDLQDNIYGPARNLQTAIGGDNFGSRLAASAENYEKEKSLAQAQYDALLISKQQFDAKMLQADRQYAMEKHSIGLSMAEDAVGVMKQGFADSKAGMLIALALEKGIAIARIMMNAEVAKSAAIAAAQMAGPLSPALEAAATARITAGEIMSVGIVAASGIIEGVGIAGRRAAGGPVEAGKTYLVGERGPELMTAGANGYVTPNDRIGGSGGIVVNATIDARGADQGVEQKIRVGMQQAVEAAYHKVKRSMDRGGEMALASGRIR